MLGVGISSIMRYFWRVGTIPLGGFRFGSPSVRSTINVFWFLLSKGLTRSSETLSPSQILVVLEGYSFFKVSETILFPVLFVLMRGSATLALLLNGIKQISSFSVINSVIVVMECFTKSKRLNPWLYTSSPPIIASKLIDSDMSRMQKIEQCGRFPSIFKGGTNLQSR